MPPYQIPLRSLIVRDGKNLHDGRPLLLGRSAGPFRARVSTTCSMMGQAAGIAAAEAVKKGCDPRDLEPDEVRKTVEDRGAKLAV